MNLLPAQIILHEKTLLIRPDFNHSGAVMVNVPDGKKLPLEVTPA